MIGRITRGMHIDVLAAISVSISVITLAFLFSKSSTTPTRSLAIHSDGPLDRDTNMCKKTSEREKIYFAGCGGFF